MCVTAQQELQQTESAVQSCVPPQSLVLNCPSRRPALQQLDLAFPFTTLWALYPAIPLATI